FGGHQRRILRCLAEPSLAEAGCRQRTCRDAQDGDHLIVSREERFLVLLQVALITRRQALARSEESEKRTIDAARFSANQLPRVRIFLLRHQAAASRILVGELDESEFR